MVGMVLDMDTAEGPLWLGHSYLRNYGNLEIVI